MPTIRTVATAALVTAGIAVSVSGLAQTADSGDANPQGLTVIRCNPATNSCVESNQPRQAIEAPLSLGPAGRATVLSPNLRSTEVSLDAAEYRVLIPGCAPREPGVFYCESVHQYQHCRTLMFSHMVHSCRAELAFQSGFADPVAADADSYRLSVDSDARLRVQRGDRGLGTIRGAAEVVLQMDPPATIPGAICLLRDRYLYRATGPDGGMSEVDDSAGCDEPIEFRFAPHNDDLLRAHDICETFSAWGDEIMDSIDILAAALFHVRSNDPAFRTTHPGGTGVVASYVEIKAPLSIECRE
jgi:hypothetical protein